MTRLHLGCGKRDFGPDWIHIDGGDFPHLKYSSITDLSQFRNNTVDLIYACHVLEYFDRDEVVMVLNEWKRVLKPGGVLRLAVPDFEELVHLYQTNKVKVEDILGPLFGKWTMGRKSIYHKTTYDKESLSKLLLEIGFKEPRYWDWKHTEHSQFDDHSQAYMDPKGDKEKGTLISLNIECIK